VTIRRGDILWADLGMFPTTSVQGGVRPVIVVSNNKANTYSSVITVVPLTSRIYKKRYLPTHVFISKYDMTGIRKGSLALAEQVMSISTKCIIEKCGRVNKWSLDRVLKAVRIQMGMNESEK
jgi:mRNA interferase MazF